jgi:pimeloyl-[acyl-carrier protein] synthase
MEHAEFESLPADFLTNPYRYYSHLREQDPVHQSKRGVWILTRYDDVVSVLQDQRFGRQGFQELLNRGRPEPPENRNVSMLFQDNLGHKRLRTLVGKAVTPALIQSLRPQIQKIVDELLDRVQHAHAIDLIAEFAVPLPLFTITELLGVPQTHRGLFHQWSVDVVRGTEAQSNDQAIERAMATQKAIADYFHEALAEHGRNPQGDLLSRLIAAEENGDKLTEFELLDICGLLFVAGHETTVNLLGNGILALFLHPRELRRLQQEPALLPSAVEELLRYDSPVQRSARVAEADVEIAAKTIPKGAIVSAVLGAANRDPARFPQADRLDITRRDNCHLAFGLGHRFCLGAALARLEGQIAIGTLLRRLPKLELADVPPAWRFSTETRGLRELPAAF